MRKKLILKVMFPVFIRKLKNFRKRTIKNDKNGFIGDYPTWEEAKKFSVGYDSSVIFDKVKNSLLKIKKGEAVYERDSVLFNKIQYSWPLLANLLWIASYNKNNLNLIDFGGSLGSTYFQNISYLKHLNCLKWNIVEQKYFVDCGKKYFEDKNLKFFYTIEECLKVQKPDVIILSSVLHYLENPYNFLEKLINFNFKYIIFDRTLFSNEKKDILRIQVVSPEIFDASYPCWFLNLSKFLSYFNDKYELVSDFEGFQEGKGFLFKKKDI